MNKFAESQPSKGKQEQAKSKRGLRLPKGGSRILSSRAMLTLGRHNESGKRRCNGTELFIILSHYESVRQNLGD